MNEFPDTSASLIAKLHDHGDAAAWDDFERIYRPVIFRIARAKGLQYADAFDLVQTVMISVASALPKYQSLTGGPPFRHWLSRITRNAILKALSRGPRIKATGGTEILDILSEVPTADAQTTALIRLEYRRELFHLAVEQIRNDVQAGTWLAFELTVIQNVAIEDAAKKLKTTPGNIYAARSRMMKRLRELVTEMERADDTET